MLYFIRPSFKKIMAKLMVNWLETVSFVSVSKTDWMFRRVKARRRIPEGWKCELVFPGSRLLSVTQVILNTCVLYGWTDTCRVERSTVFKYLPILYGFGHRTPFKSWV